MTAPKSGPTSGDVRKSPRRPAAPPAAKNPCSGSYSASSTTSENGTGPRAETCAATSRSSSFTGSPPSSTPSSTPTSERTLRDSRRSHPTFVVGGGSDEVGHVAEAAHDLRVEADGDGGQRADAERGAERGRHSHPGGVTVGHRLEPHLLRDACVVEERDHRVDADEDRERVTRGRPCAGRGAEDHELGEPPT